MSSQSTPVAAPRYETALEQTRTGALSLARGSSRLALLFAGDGLGLVRRQVAGRLEQRRSATKGAGHGPTLPAAESDPTSRFRVSAVRLGVGVAVLAVVAGGAAAVIRWRRSNQVPEPAAAPPSLRASTNGAPVRPDEAELTDLQPKPE